MQENAGYGRTRQDQTGRGPGHNRIRSGGHTPRGVAAALTAALAHRAASTLGAPGSAQPRSVPDIA
eukprot:1248375-Rhodomonas_salina.2